MRQHNSMLFVFVALSLVMVEGNHLSFSLSGLGPGLGSGLGSGRAASNSYKSLLKDLRQTLTVGSDLVYGIPVLNQSVPSSKRFIYVDFTNNVNESISIAMDVENVNIVGYLTKNESYIFPDAPRIAVKTLFSTSSKRNILNFSSSYRYLEKAAKSSRLEIPLGLDPFDTAISNLFHYSPHKSLASAFIVIFQMISEAVRFKYIEQSVANSISYGYEFTPGQAILSLENNWETLSELIQGSLTLQGIFGDIIELFGSENQSIRVDSIYYQIILPNVALQLYRCHFSTSDGNVAVPSFISMPLERNIDPCQVLKRTIRISGRDGLCANVEAGAEIVLWPCGSEVNQKWAFQRDGTIQSLGKCMTVVEDSAVLSNCSLARTESVTWEISKDGTIKNPSTGLVLTAEEGIRNTSLKAKANTYITGQAWRAGVNVDPIVASIIGLNDTCLEATNGNTNTWMEGCVKDKREQNWALFSDQTIRVNDDRSQCVTTSGFRQLDLIVINPCDGSATQRWTFTSDNAIVNPKSGMVMDVKLEDVAEKEIILHALHGKANQQWLPFY